MQCSVARRISRDHHGDHPPFLQELIGSAPSGASLSILVLTESDQTAELRVARDLCSPRLWRKLDQISDRIERDFSYQPDAEEARGAVAEVLSFLRRGLMDHVLFTLVKRASPPALAVLSGNPSLRGDGIRGQSDQQNLIELPLELPFEPLGRPVLRAAERLGETIKLIRRRMGDMQFLLESVSARALELGPVPDVVDDDAVGDDAPELDPRKVWLELDQNGKKWELVWREGGVLDVGMGVGRKELLKCEVPAVT